MLSAGDQILVADVDEQVVSASQNVLSADQAVVAAEPRLSRPLPFHGRGGGIRTHDLFVPNDGYQGRWLSWAGH
jgi:hypothetical protein